MKRKRVTIQDVADHVGVSRQTVSRVINDKDDVSEETRRKVLEAIDDLGYRLNASARDLAQSHTASIAIVMPYNPDYLYTDPHLLQLVCGVDRVLGQRGFNLLLSSAPLAEAAPPTPTPEHALSAYRRLANADGVDGVIVVETVASRVGVDLLKARGYTWITLGYSDPESPDRAVHADDYGGARQATMHLLSLGHRRIGVIGGSEMTPTAFEERLAGCRKTMEEHHLHLDPALIVGGDLTAESGYRAAARLMAQDAPPTAIFALNDTMALGALDYLQSHGWDVPGQISLVGFDDVPATRTSDPPLTTVRQPAQEMGHQAARLILELLDDYLVPTETIVLPTELVIRMSTGPVAS